MLDPLVITFTADDLEDVRAVTVECIYSALCGLEDSDEVAKSLSGVQNVLTLLGAWHRLGCGCLGFIEPGGLTADGMEALAAALPELLGFYERSTSP